jgi:hypothetical protein
LQVTDMSVREKLLALDSGRFVKYDKILIATGEPRRRCHPGHRGLF